MRQPFLFGTITIYALVAGPPPFAGESWCISYKELLKNAAHYYQCSIPYWFIIRY